MKLFVVVEHIASHDALELPLADVLALVRQRAPRAVLIVDGAHTPGTRRDMPLADADDVLFAGNLHKWFMAPRG